MLSLACQILAQFHDRYLGKNNTLTHALSPSCAVSILDFKNLTRRLKSKKISLMDYEHTLFQDLENLFGKLGAR